MASTNQKVSKEDAIKQLTVVNNFLLEMSLGASVVMVGAADSDYRLGLDKKTAHPSLRSYPYELINLWDALNQDSQKETTVIFAFDESYRIPSIVNDIRNLNKHIFKKLRRGSVSMEGLSNANFDTLVEHSDLKSRLFDTPGELMEFDKNEERKTGVRWSFTLDGSYLIFFFNFNLETSYPDITAQFENIALRTKPQLQMMTETCEPKPDTPMAALQILLTSHAFTQSYLYNCAWWGGAGGGPRTGRHFEHFCELLYIFKRLPNAFLLSDKDMDVTFHRNGKREYPMVVVTPLNATTRFIRDRNGAGAGGTRKARNPRKVSKRKHSRKH